tara:strand:+ start:278 stop:406 length:129 start_codon:yes stop_codon:yes gene_type:complete
MRFRESDIYTIKRGFNTSALKLAEVLKKQYFCRPKFKGNLPK